MGALCTRHSNVVQPEHPDQFFPVYNQPNGTAASYYNGPSCTRLNAECLNSGAFGCFISFTHELYTIFIENIDKFNIIQYNDMEEEITHKETFLNNLLFKGFKIMLSQLEDESDADYLNEYNAYKLINSLGQGLINDYTTYYEYNNSAFYIITFNNAYLNLTINKEGETRKYTKIKIILNNLCSADLESLLEKKKIIDPIEVYNNIIPFLNILHSHNITHMDIKPSNILKCSDKFKLCDFGTLKFNRSIRDSGIPSTLGSILPILSIYPENIYYIDKNLYNDNLQWIRWFNNFYIFEMSMEKFKIKYHGLTRTRKTTLNFIENNSAYFCKKSDHFALAAVLMRLYHNYNLNFGISEELTRILYEILTNLLEFADNPNPYPYPYPYPYTYGGNRKNKKYVKSTEKWGNKCIYLGKRGGKYIKLKGNFISIKNKILV